MRFPFSGPSSSAGLTLTGRVREAASTLSGRAWREEEGAKPRLRPLGAFLVSSFLLRISASTSDLSCACLRRSRVATCRDARGGDAEDLETPADLVMCLFLPSAEWTKHREGGVAPPSCPFLSNGIVSTVQRLQQPQGNPKAQRPKTQSPFPLICHGVIRAGLLVETLSVSSWPNSWPITCSRSIQGALERLTVSPLCDQATATRGLLSGLTHHARLMFFTVHHARSKLSPPCFPLGTYVPSQRTLRILFAQCPCRPPYALCEPDYDASVSR